jgi:hypothetical protein
MQKEVFFIKIAGLTVEMRAKYPLSRKRCRDYLCEPVGTPDIIAEVSDEEIVKEIDASGEDFSPAYCEDICLYRAIAEQLPKYDRFVFHGAALSANDRGYMFSAPAGTGKSTHARLWLEQFEEKVGIINGDKPIISLSGDSATVCSTPWAGKEGWQRNVSLHLDGICLLSRATNNRIERIDPSDYFAEIIRQVYIPKDGEARLRTLELLDKLANRVKFWHLECNISPEAARTSYDAMVKSGYLI